MYRSIKPIHSLQLVKCMGLIGLALILLHLPAAGQIIIDGTDANDHGDWSGGVNHQGWEYMERALARIGERVQVPHARTVVALGTEPGSWADQAIGTAFEGSSLPGQGWTLVRVDGPFAIAQWLAGLSPTDTGLLYIPTAGHTAGDLDPNELAVINSQADRLRAYTAAGGGLFAMAETGAGAWGWLSTYAPDIAAFDVGPGGISTDMHLTADGQRAFPGLTDDELADADPWHSYFEGNFGAFRVLATAPDDQGVVRNVMLGAGVAGEVTPEPGPLAVLVSAGVAGTCLRQRRHRAPRSSPANCL